MAICRTLLQLHANSYYTWRLCAMASVSANDLHTDACSFLVINMYSQC